MRRALERQLPPSTARHTLLKFQSAASAAPGPSMLFKNVKTGCAPAPKPKQVSARKACVAWARTITGWISASQQAYGQASVKPE